jgi:hypothetical protein
MVMLSRLGKWICTQAPAPPSRHKKTRQKAGFFERYESESAEVR